MREGRCMSLTGRLKLGSELEKQPCQITSRSDLKRHSLSLSEEHHPNKNKKNKMSSDMSSVPDLSIYLKSQD